MTIPEDDKEDNPDSNRHDSDPEKLAEHLLGDMLTDNFGMTIDKESDKNSQLLGNELLGTPNLLADDEI